MKPSLSLLLTSKGNAQLQLGGGEGEKKWDFLTHSFSRTFTSISTILLVKLYNVLNYANTYHELVHQKTTSLHYDLLKSSCP